MNYSNYQPGYFSNNLGQNQYAQQPQGQQIPQTQPLFPQPNGNVYNINNTLEVANVPAGVGLSVALCLPEGLMYIKTMQNGTPMFWAYKIEPYDSKNEKNREQENLDINNGKNDYEIKLEEELRVYRTKIEALEKQVALIKKGLGGNE